MPESLRDFPPKVPCVASTAKRLCSQAQGWTAGTTLGNGGGGAFTPTGLWPTGFRGGWFCGHGAATPLGLTGLGARLPRLGAAPSLGFATQPRWGCSFPPRSSSS